jgi:hypothetical protein
MPWNETPANEAVIAAKAPAQTFVFTPLRSQKFPPDASNLCAGWGSGGARFYAQFSIEDFSAGDKRARLVPWQKATATRLSRSPKPSAQGGQCGSSARGSRPGCS